ncbi:hypothetical protein Tco_0860339 [Tanacetum coccineum]|uniref:Uncharacterized protein n=1 Tax=Tanacetum coccineum TaxID=301880 RepID=A0ABQ5BHN7_9ASTR
MEPAWSIPSSSLSVPIHNWASTIASSYVPPPKNSLLSQTGDIGVFIDWFCKKKGITELTRNTWKVLHMKLRQLPQYNVAEPTPLGGPPGQVMIQTEFFFNIDLDYLRFGSKGDRIAVSITKMKAAYYPDVGLEQMVPDHMCIEEECMYDIFATYGISHWWFRRQKFYIDRHSAETNRRAIIVLRRADNQEYTIAENDFKDLYPSDFKDLYLLNLQGHLNHLPPRDKKILSSAPLPVNTMESESGYQTTGLEFMHDYKILDSPRAVVFRDTYGMQMIMRFNKIHKFSDGTLQQIDEALDYRVKEFRVNKVNPGLDTSSEESSGTWRALLVEEYEKETTDFFREQNDDIFSISFSTSCVVLRIILVILPEHPSDTYVLTMKMEILLELTSNKLMVAISGKLELGTEKSAFESRALTISFNSINIGRYTSNGCGHVGPLWSSPKNCLFLDKVSNPCLNLSQNLRASISKEQYNCFTRYPLAGAPGAITARRQYRLSSPSVSLREFQQDSVKEHLVVVVDDEL